MAKSIEDEYVYETYEQIATGFSSSRYKPWPAVQKFVEQIPENKLILDAGCGNGKNMLIKPNQFIGIDTCNNFISICKERNLNVVFGNITNIPFDNNYFDV